MKEIIGRGLGVALPAGFQWAFWVSRDYRSGRVPVTFLLIRRRELARAVAAVRPWENLA
jgi:hypothetical protein